jgi:hypothetical protein
MEQKQERQGRKEFVESASFSFDGQVFFSGI